MMEGRIFVFSCQCSDICEFSSSRIRDSSNFKIPRIVSLIVVDLWRRIESEPPLRIYSNFN